MADTRLELQIVADAKAANSALESLISTLGKVREAVKSGLHSGGADKSYVQATNSISRAMEAAESSTRKFGGELSKVSATAKDAATKTSDSVAKMADGFEAATSKVRTFLSELDRVKGQTVSSDILVGDSLPSVGKDADLQFSLDTVNSLAQGMSAAFGEAVPRVEELNAAFADPSIKNYTAETQAMRAALDLTNIGSVASQIKEVGVSAGDASTSTKTLAERLKELGKAFAGARGHSNNLLSSFIRIAKYRFLRAILREITEGVTTGVKNMYEYAKAVGLSFAPAVDAAKDALFRMKNSIGAALAPLIEMLIPYLMQAVQWFINLVNIVNQFFALLNGQTEWTRAVSATSDAMDDVKTSAGGAAKAIKEVKGLLADWDELNIIQQEPSDTGSGGGSGKTKKAEIDYTKMFEQVDVFDGKIREVVNWIKDNFNAILDIAKWVGAAILGWNISTALGGIIGTLSGWVATGILATLTFKVVTLLNDNYLKTGAPGWLIGNALTTALGAGLAAKLTKQFVSKNYAGQAVAVGAAIVLTFSAAADIVAAIRNTDVSALDEKNLSLAVIGALKGGLAVAFVSHAFGAKKMQAGLLSLGSIGTIFGVEVGIKAVQGVIDTGEITNETLAANIISALTVGAGAMFIAKGAGLAWEKAGLAGLAAAGITVAAELGIEVVVGTVNAKKLTEENVLNALGAMGGGAAGAGAIALLAGASLPVAMAIGGGAALATGLVIAAAIGIGLAIAEKDGIKWGNVKLTEEQVQAFVKEKMFSADVQAKINLINSKVEASQQELQNVKTQAAELFSTLNVLALGIDDKGSLKEAHTQVKQFVEAIEKYAETQTAVLKTGISVIPVINEAGEDVSAEVLAKGITGWQGVTSYMTDLGKQLSDALIDGTTGEMKTDWDSELVKTILDKVSNVNKAVMQAQTAGNAREQFGATLFGLDDLSRDSFDKVMDAYKGYSDQLKASMYNVYYQEVSSFEQLAAYYEAMAKNEAGTERGARYADMAADYKAEAVRLAGLLEDRVQDALDGELEHGRKMVLDWLTKMFADPIENAPDFLTVIGNHRDAFEQNFASGMQAVFSDISGVPIEALQLFNITGWDFLSSDLQEEFISHLHTLFDDDSVFSSGVAVDVNAELAKLGIKVPVTPVVENKVLDDAITSGLIEELIKIPPELEGKSESGIYRVPLSVEYEVSSPDDVSEQLDDILDETASGYEVEVDTSALETPVVLPAAETSVFTSSVESAVTSVSASMEATAKSTASSVMGQINAVHQALLATINDWYFLTGGVTSSHNTARRDFHFASGSRYHYAYASGGFPETGDYFLARESGPELVGTMGNRTAVANNDQIVAGIASGVAAAQQEQNTLLRQQNEYLRRLLAKESTVKVEPSSKWGRFQRQSEAMYARNTGTGG